MTVGGLPDAARGEYPAGITADQQCQHHPRVILRLAAARAADVKRRHINALNRFNYEMGQIIIGHPILQIRRQQKPLGTVIGTKILLHTYQQV